MINFRFHLVSIVAVFLALGVGVAMGASFIDRATVETMRGRLDQLETNYRERGDEIDSLQGRVEAQDRAAAALVEDGSALLADRLAETTVVMITAEGTPPEGAEAARTALGTAGASDGGQLVVDLERLGADADALDDVRELVGLGVAAPVRVRERVLSSLGEALGVLAHGSPDDAEPAPAGPGGTGGPDPTTAGAPGEGGTPEGEGGPGTTAGTEEVEPQEVEPEPEGADADAPSEQERADAEQFVQELIRIGVVRLEPSELTAAALFGDDPVRFVLVVDPDGTATDAGSGAEDGPGSAGVPAEPGLRDLSFALATAAPRVLVVAEPATTTSSPEGEPDRSTGQLLSELRDDETSAALMSSVDHLDEVIGRVALVLALEEQAVGRVGHYGSGEGAVAALPRVPE